MSDTADVAETLVQEHLTRSLRSIDATIPVGVAGECDECGEIMPRLVGGRCAFCRDGRVPPPSFFEIAAPAAPLSPPIAEEKMAMPDVVSSRKIMIEGRALRAIEQLADERGLSFKDAADELFTAAADARQPAPPASSSVEPFDGSQESAMQWLAELPNAWLADELARRMGGVSDEEHGAAIARAEAAEAQLAKVRDLVGSAVS